MTECVSMLLFANNHKPHSAEIDENAIKLAGI